MDGECELVFKKKQVRGAPLARGGVIYSSVWWPAIRIHTLLFSHLENIRMINQTGVFSFTII